MFSWGLTFLTIDNSLTNWLMIVLLFCSTGMVFLATILESGTCSAFTTVPEFPAPIFPN
ncbi:YDL159C-A [Saccharomyces cerevisiae synthetic construct]|uniref:Putative uncharacterized protein YDL159C-B n=2 Tax=Saccharomyces cerevisiae TaxID=4932 RepID=YD59B_YEAST|nr:RecName: Full=Putative uncharacterized protein YDL159C-B [Saccharomyces cerevisiae S288C]AAL79252.1 unknown [Saccharomyces cerevisiae]EWG96851.1 hypothetical protein R103_D20536 [Saccharomyces cerevisiae R103]WNF19647.1 YDL159C-A [Saccharomyces cerevisiae synthetic construct]CAY78351.1 EC1118_1D0_0551p [Saccharomyces cerevisiae EC1118]KZV12067.1 hypothetical protein WN66_00881 [Saccharomyces cerevisiae]